MKTLRSYKPFLLCLSLMICPGCGRQAAREVADMDFDWKFLAADEQGAQTAEFDDTHWRDVQVPHDWSIEGPYSEEYASGTGYLPGGVGWYRKSFTLDSALRGKQVSIEFDGVYNNSDVWINGIHLGKRPFGYISFQYDLTPYLIFGGMENVLAVRVDHSAFADSRWYTGSGIYRHVRLTVTDPLHIDHWGTYITTPVANQGVAELQVETTVCNADPRPTRFTLDLKILDAQGKTVKTVQTEESIAAGATAVFTNKIPLLNPGLWSPDSPTLYALESRIVNNRKVVDETNTRFGIRCFEFDPDTGFLLNGENMKLKGVCLHHDAGALGAAVPEKIWRRRFEKLKEIGCNAIRCSHNPPAPEFLDLCDEMGFLVMDETFDEFTPGKRKWIKGRNVGQPGFAGYNEVFEEWAVRDIQDMVRRDRNHPSIIMWSIGNEIDYPNDPFSHPADDNYNSNQPSAENITPYAQMLVEAVRELDATRPVTAAIANAPASNQTGYADALDIVGYNYQERLYEQDHAKYPDRVLYGSENGLGLNEWQAVVDHDYISGQFLWTGIDYLGESPGWPVRSWTNALLDLCDFKKPTGWLRQSLWSEEPMVYLNAQIIRSGQGQGRRGRGAVVSSWNAEEGQEVRVTCYTNCDEVDLLLNDTSLGTQSVPGARTGALTWTVPFEKGVLKAVGKRGGKAVGEYVLQTAEPAARIKLVPDTTELAADGKDVCCLEFYVTDENGVRIFDAQNQITFTVTGPASILGIGNGNSSSHESHQDNIHAAWEGRGLAVIRAARTTGTVTIEASAEGLEGDIVTLKIR